MNDDLWRIYGIINDWIRFADTKAGAILAVNGIIAGLAIPKVLACNDFLDKNPVFYVFLVIGGITTCGSIYYSIRCLWPILKIGKPTSLIYFAHIAQKFETSEGYKQNAQDVFSDDKKVIDQVTQQIWANSKVAWKKYKRVAWATYFLSFTVSICTISVIVSAFI